MSKENSIDFGGMFPAAFADAAIKKALSFFDNEIEEQQPDGTIKKRKIGAFILMPETVTVQVKKTFGGLSGKTEQKKTIVAIPMADNPIDVNRELYAAYVALINENKELKEYVNKLQIKLKK